jgi:hypothetical protein
LTLGGTLAIANGGTGQTTANAAFNALAPSQTGNSGKYLTTDGTDTSWATNPLGTVTSVAATVPSFLSITGSPITTSGTLAFSLSGTALPTTSGGTGLTSFTANGVVYASSSSALATSANLTYNGTNLSIGNGAAGNFEVGSGGYGLVVSKTNVGAVNAIRSVSDTSNILLINDSASGFANTAFYSSGSEAMRLTSTGLGIGTSSPAYKLEVQTSGTSAGLWVQTGGTTSSYTIADFRTGTNASALALYGNITAVFGGNVGLGVTPSAWGIGKALQVNNASMMGYLNRLYASANTYFDGTGTGKYIATDYATSYQQLNGQHQWFNAPSGTAGNAITFTQAMTLDASGNLGIGTSSPSYKLHVAATAVTAGYFTSSAAATTLTIDNSNANAWGGNLAIATQGTTAGYFGTIGSLLGTTTQDLAVWATAGNGFRVYTNGNNERARIDSSGNLLVGTTTAIGKVTSDNTSTTANNGVFRSGVNSYTGNNLISSSYTAAGTGWNIFLGQSGNGSSVTNNCIFILGNGNVQNQNNSYGAISDIKLKENIVDATPKLDKLMQVRVRNYNLKGEYQQHKQLGVIAQELEAVFPAMIEEVPDKDMEGNELGTITKTVKYSVFVPMLIKALQEQQAIIESLKARLDAANL